jgi:hypothetical protein
LLADTKSLQPPPVKVPELIERCIKLELQAKRIYERLAGRFEILSRVVCGRLADFSSGGGFGLFDSVYEGNSLNHVGDPF